MVTFYKLDDNGVPMYPVLYLDTLKVSTIEQTAETTDARGGKGNAKLITWDYNKEITVTLEDALFSAKSLAIMFGNGSAATITGSSVMRTETFTATSAGSSATAIGWNSQFIAPNGKTYEKINPKFYNANEVAQNKSDVTTVTSFEKGQTYFCSYDISVNGSVIDISADSFPGTYYVTGDTFARSNNSGEDQFFQFIIPKAKVTSENTITLEAEGDPSVFNMNLTVLKPATGSMMRLVQYDLAGEGGDATVAAENLVHNHDLGGANG